MKNIVTKLLIVFLFLGSVAKSQVAYDLPGSYQYHFYDGKLSTYNAIVSQFYPPSSPCSFCMYIDSLSPGIFDGGYAFPGSFVVFQGATLSNYDTATFLSLYADDLGDLDPLWTIDKPSMMTKSEASDSITSMKVTIATKVTQSQSRSAISLTTTGSGAATYNSSTGVMNIPTPVTSSGTVTSVTAGTGLTGGVITTTGTIALGTTGVAAGKYDWLTTDIYGRITAAGNMATPTAIASGGRNFNQAYQISSTVQSRISVSAKMSCVLSLTSGASGTILLEISANGTSGWIYQGEINGSNTGSLTIGLNTTQITGGQLIADLPAGYYWRLTTTNVSGTPTYTFNGGNYITY